jgi:hypothetical protein
MDRKLEDEPDELAGGTCMIQVVQEGSYDTCSHCLSVGLLYMLYV